MSLEEDKKYIVTTETRVVNGKTFKIINRHPVLEPDEKERRHQGFLQCASKICEKYNIK